jgi:hypothetical protein
MYMTKAHKYHNNYVIELIDNLNLTYSNRYALCKRYNKRQYDLNVANYVKLNN